MSKKYTVYTATPTSILKMKKAWDLWKEDPKAIDKDRADRFKRIDGNKEFESAFEGAVGVASNGIALAVDFYDICDEQGYPKKTEGTKYYTYCVICWARRYWNGGDLDFRPDASNES